MHFHHKTFEKVFAVSTVYLLCILIVEVES